jgi:hypothetical protein
MNDDRAEARKYRALQVLILQRARERGEVESLLGRGQPIDVGAELQRLPVAEAVGMVQAVEDTDAVDALLRSIAPPSEE